MLIFLVLYSPPAVTIGRAFFVMEIHSSCPQPVTTSLKLSHIYGGRQEMADMHVFLLVRTRRRQRSLHSFRCKERKMKLQRWVIPSKENTHAMTPEDTTRIFILQQFDAADYIIKKFSQVNSMKPCKLGGAQSDFLTMSDVSSHC